MAGRFSDKRDLVGVLDIPGPVFALRLAALGLSHTGIEPPVA